MATKRRTISLPPYLADQLEREAAARGITFSALVVELIEKSLGPQKLSYVGMIDDDPDLSLRVEEILARHLRQGDAREQQGGEGS
jgi:hypothetical protein